MVLLCIAWNIQQIHATKRKTKFSFQWTFKKSGQLPTTGNTYKMTYLESLNFLKFV